MPEFLPVWLWNLCAWYGLASLSFTVLVIVLALLTAPAPVTRRNREDRFHA